MRWSPGVNIYYIFCNYNAILVTGEANFSMEKQTFRSLTVGGFNQPAVARTLIELPGNAEKGLSQRFLWLYPKPIYGKFETLEPVREDFIETIGECCLTFRCAYTQSWEWFINHISP